MLKVNKKNNLLILYLLTVKIMILSHLLRIILGNVHDSQITIDLMKQSKRAFPNIKRVISDDWYKNP